MTCPATSTFALRPRSRHRSRGQHGFSLLELIVVLGLMMVAILAAAALIDSSIRLIESTGRSLRDPSLTIAEEWLRRDVHEAAALWSWSSEWNAAPLLLLGHDGTRVVFEFDGRTLARIQLDDTGNEMGRIIILRGLLTWRWRSPVPGLVEVEITVPAHLDPIHASHLRDPRRLAAVELRTEHLRLAMRGTSGGRSW